MLDRHCIGQRERTGINRSRGTNNEEKPKRGPQEGRPDATADGGQAGNQSQVLSELKREIEQVILFYGIHLRILLVFINGNSERFQKFVPAK